MGREVYLIQPKNYDFWYKFDMGQPSNFGELMEDIVFEYSSNYEVTMERFVGTGNQGEYVDINFDSLDTFLKILDEYLEQNKEHQNYVKNSPNYYNYDLVLRTREQLSKLDNKTYTLRFYVEY